MPELCFEHLCAMGLYDSKNLFCPEPGVGGRFGAAEVNPADEPVCIGLSVECKTGGIRPPVLASVEHTNQACADAESIASSTIP